MSDGQPDLIFKQINRIIIPFTYDQDFQQACSTYLEAESSGKAMWKVKDFSLSGLFQHICGLISSEETDVSVGRRFVLDQTGRAYYGLPHKTNTIFTLGLKKKTIALTIPAVQVVLFKSGVGFVVVELGYKEDAEIEDVIDGNYFFKSFHRSDLEMSFIKTIAKDESAEVRITPSQLILNFINHLNVLDFFNDKDSKAGNSIVGAHALVYSGILFDRFFSNLTEYEEQLKQYLFWMRRSFKESYKPAPGEFSLDNNPEVLQLFQNSYWGISVEGLANIAYLVDDDETNQFFSGNYYGNLENTYFFMYLLALHQRYTLLKFIKEAALLPYPLDRKISYKEAQDLNEQIYRLRKKIAYFVLRSTFYQVSNITHHNKLYKQIQQSLGITDLQNELELELQMLASINSIEEQIRRDRKDEREKSLEDFITLISTMFVLITTTQAVWSMYTYYVLKQIPPLWSSGFWVSVIILLIMWVTALLGYAYFSRKRRTAAKDN
ncbi:MAG: hypothetical protein ACM3QW_07250 [Ignavibacteriales bacterium]